MKREEEIKKTVEFIDVMIQNADKGVSGFWTDDFEGCGNPSIYPEFEKGLHQHGTYVKKEHYCCPWQTNILYGGNKSGTGCYYHCSIEDARYLTPKMVKSTLENFKKNLLSGEYTNNDISTFKSILSDRALAYLKNQKQLEKRLLEKKRRIEKEKQNMLSSNWIKKYLNKLDDKEYIRNIIAGHYGTKEILNSKFGVVFFDADDMKNVVGTEEMSYDEFLYIQFKNNSHRDAFIQCYFEIPSNFKGCITKISENFICFNKLHVEGMYNYDLSFFDGVEDHVWMSKEGFEKFKVGDCVSFYAEVYRYIKTGNGKSLEYGLRNPGGIKKIEEYKLPTEKEMLEQQISLLVCDTCFYHENCNGFCIRDKKEIRQLKQEIKKLMMNDDKSKE